MEDQVLFNGEDYETVSGVDEAPEVAVGGQDIELLAADTEAETPQEATQQILAKTRENIASGLSPDMDMDAYLEQSVDAFKKAGEYGANPHFSAHQGELVKDPEVTNLESRFESNFALAREMANKALDDRNGYWTGYGADAFDYLFLRNGANVVEDLTGRDTEMSQQILNLMVSTPTDQFPAAFQSFLEEMKSEGIFTSNNYFAIARAVEALENQGYDPQRVEKAFLSSVDVAAPIITPLAAAKLAKRVVSKTRRNRPSSTVGRIAQASGSQAAGNAANRVLSQTPHAPTAAVAGPAPLDIGQSTTRPSQNKFVSMVTKSQIARDIHHLWREGTFGRAYDEADALNAGAAAARSYAKRMGSPIHSYFIADEFLGALSTTIRLGRKKDGEPFAALTQHQATTYNNGSFIPGYVVDQAKKVGGQVVPYDPSDLRKGYLIEVTERMDTEDLVGPHGPNPFAASNYVREVAGKILASADWNDLDELSNTAKMAEAGQAAIKGALEPSLKKLRKLSFDSKARHTLNAVYRDLRDGAGASMRRRYNKTEFETKWQQFHPNGATPTQDHYEAYRALGDIEKAEYIIKAIELTHFMVKKGFDKAVDVGRQAGGNVRFRAAKAVDDPTTLKRDTDVFDTTTNTGKVRSDFTNQQPIWELESPVEVNGKAYKYVARPKNVRVVEPTDLLGYNPGGRRYDSKASHFFINDTGGNRLKTMFSARSENEARKGLREIETIKDALARNLPNIDDIIRLNNSWDESITDLASLRRAIQDRGWDFTGTISYKSKNNIIESNEISNYSGMSWGDFIRNDLTRSDTPLPTYGGGTSAFEDPVNAVLSQFADSSFTLSHKQYTLEAITGWVKAHQNAEGEWLEHAKTWFRNDIPKDDYLRHFINANIPNDGSAATRKARDLRNITMRRLSMQDSASHNLRTFSTRMAEWVFDKSGGKWKPSPGDPTGAILKLGFHSAFGFFNVSQFFMQSFHALAISTISPYGAKSAAMALPIRLTFGLTDPAHISEAYKRIGKYFNMSEEEVGEMVDYIRLSGRDFISGDAAEQGSGIGFNLSGWGSNRTDYKATAGIIDNIKNGAIKGLELGTYPFRQGERVARLTGIITAVREYKAKYPGVSIRSDAARKWITDREQTLGFNMTGTSRGLSQAGLLKIPTQWLTYTMRSMEALISPNMTVGERARLFTVLAPMFGLTGFGAGNAMDYIVEKTGIEPGGKTYIAMKYGVLDWATSYLLGEENAIGFGNRLAPIGAFLDVYKNITEENFLAVVGGPSGEITEGAVTQLWKVLKNVANGRGELTYEEALRFLRQPSGVDNWFKMAAILKYGVYQSKTGSIAGPKMGITDAIATVFGFTPLAVVEMYDLSRQQYLDDKNFKTLQREISNNAGLALELMETGDEKDWKRGVEILDDISLQIEAYDLPFEMERQLHEAVYQHYGRISKLQALMKKAIRKDNEVLMKISEKFMLEDHSND